MPLFMLVSGYVSYRNIIDNIFSYIKKRTYRLLIPYVFWTIVFCLAMKYSLWGGLVVTPVYWFLILLFIIGIIMIAVQTIASYFHIKSEFLCLLVVLLLFLLNWLLHIEVLSLNIIHVHFLFYAIGWYLSKHSSILSHNWLITPTMFLFFVCGWFYRRNYSPLIYPFSSPSIYLIISGICGSVFFLLLFKLLFNRQSILANIGRMTLGIYVIHLLFCNLISSYSILWVENVGRIMGVTTCFFISTAISMVCCTIMGRNKYSKKLI